MNNDLSYLGLLKKQSASAQQITEVFDHLPFAVEIKL